MICSTRIGRRCPGRTALLNTLLLLLAFSATAQEIFEQDKGVWATSQLNLSAPIAAGERLVIRAAETLAGKITILATETDQATVLYTKRATTDSRSRAIDYIDLIALDIAPIAKGARLQLRAPNPAPWGAAESGSVEVEIRVPEGVFVDVEALYFDVTAEGPFSGVLIPASLGRLEVYRVNGPVDLATANRRLVLEDATGKISAQTSNSTLTAANIESRRQQAVFRNDGGEIRIDGFTGEISARNDFGIIEITDFHPLGRRNVIRGQSAPIILEVIDLGESRLVVSNRFEDIDITTPSDLSAEISLAVGEGGRIEVSGLKFQTDLVQRDRLGLVVGEGFGFLSSSISGHGNIYIRGREQGEG